MPPQEFANQIVQSGKLPDLIAGVRRNKALATVLESAVITDESGNTVDLSALSPAAMADLVNAEDGGATAGGDEGFADDDELE
jgi:trigger factor